MMRPSILLLLCAFVAIGNVFTKPLSSKGRGIHIQTHRLMGFMKYAADISSGVMIYIPSSINMCSGIHKLIGGGIQTHTDISLLLESTLNWDASVTVLSEFSELYLSMYTAYS